MAKKPLQTLYESLRANNYDVPDNYGSFERTLTAPGTEGVRNRQTLYKALRANNYDVPDTYESFSRTLFAPVKPTGGTVASGQSMLPADVEERRMRTRNRRGTHPLNKSRARQRLQQQQQAIEAQQKRWEQDNKRFKEDIARREKRLPGGMDRFEERAKEQLATGEASPMPLAPNDEVVRGDIVFNPSTGRMQQTYTTPEGGTFFDRNTAEFDHSLQNMPEDEIELLERERELIGMGILRRGRELDEEYENQSWWDRFLAGLATDPEMGPGPHERMVEGDEEMQSLLTAWRKNRDALRILYDERNNDMNSFWHNFGTTVANGYTFTGGRAELHDAQAILNSSKRMDEIQRKMKAGEKLSNVENAALSLAQNTAWDNAIQAMYGDDYGAWATAGGAAVQSLEMMPEFIAGMPVLKGMGSAAIKLLTRNAANGLGRFMLKGLGATLGTMAGGAIMANTIQATRTLGKAEGNAVGSWWFGDDGDFMLGHYEGDNFVSGGESLGAALFHAEREAIPEAASEGAGEFLHLGAWGGKALAKIGLSRIAKPLASLSGKGWYKTYQNMLKAAGWHGVGGEAFEEYIGTLDGLLMGDLEGVKRLGDPRTHIDIWLSCATLGPLLNAPVVLGSSMRAAYSPVAYHKIKAAVTRQDKIASFRLTEDRWAPWRERIDATPNEQMADVLMEVRDSQDLAPQEKKAIFDYAKALQGYRGWNLGEYIFGKDAEEEGEGKSEQEQQQSQEYSNGYETVTPEERRAAKDRLDVARARLESKGYSEQWMQWVESTPIDDVMSDLTERGLAGDTEAVTEYLNAKAAYDGMLARVNDDIDDEVAIANEAIEQRVAPENAGGDGMIHPAVLKGGREVFIISGNVATLADNSIDVENSDSMIIVRDAEGNEDTISPDKIQSLGEVQDPAQQRQEVEQQIVDEQGQAAAAQIEGQLPFNVGDQYTITYQGEPHTYQVVYADENNVAVLVDGGQEPVVLTKQQLQQMADEEHAQQIQAQAAAADAVEEEPAEEPSQSDDTVDQAAPVTEEAPVAPEDNPSPSMPMDDQGEPAWNQVAPEIGHQYLYQQSGWPQAMADNFVQARIDEAEKALKKAQDEAQKLIDKPKKTVAENNAAMAQNTAALQAAQAALDYWNAVQAIQAQATAPVVEEATPTVETPAEQESTEQAAPVAEVEEPAAPVEETPAAEDEQPEQSLDAAVAEAEQMTDTNPTEGQKEAGNYRKGHVNVHGFEISIEQPKGSVRSGVDADGHEWSQEMHNTYGYIQGTEGVDGDHIDVFLSDHLDDWNGLVFVVDQVNKDGSFDEHKVMIGFNSTKEAQEAYLSNYEEGWTGLGNITVINEFDFKDWINSSHRKTKPFAEYNIAREKAILEEEESEQPAEAPVAENEMQPVEEPVVEAPATETAQSAATEDQAGGDNAPQSDAIPEQPAAAEQVAREEKAANIEAGGAVVDQLQRMGVDVNTDLNEYRKTLSEAKKDKSEAGKVRYLKNSDGTTYGFVYRGKINIDPRKINAELPLHEYGHLWAEAIRAISPERWQQIVDVLKSDADTWSFLQGRRPDLQTDDEIAEEIIAEFSGKNGEAKLKAELERLSKTNSDYKTKWGNIYKNIVKAIQDFWKQVGDFLQIDYTTPQQIYDQVLKDFASGMNPRERVERFLQERDAEFVDAVNRGDMATATRLFNEALTAEVGNGMTPFISVGSHKSSLGNLARKVKRGDKAAIEEVAKLMAPIIPENAVLIPAPSHTGRATYMLDIANAIAKITGSDVADILVGPERGTQYEQKKATGKAMTSAELGVTVEGELPEGKIPVVLDNVVATGNTAEACVQALGKGIVCSLTKATDQYNHAATLKSANVVVRDANGNVIPLSKRFDLSQSKRLGNIEYQEMPNTLPGNHIELNYESGKDAESRAYIEEVMEREGWDEDAKSEFRKILDDAADLVSRMAQGFTRLREWNNKKLTDEQGNYNPLWRVWDKAVGWIPNRSSFKKNGEYPYNIDLGALCTKREAFDAVVRYIKEQGWGQNLGPNQIEALKSLLREHGFLTACDICFNETKRARALDYGNAVAYYWNAVRQAVGIDDDLPVGTPRELTDEQVKRLTALAASKNGKAFSKYIPKEVRRTYETYVNSKGKRKRREADKGLTPTMTAKIAKLFLQDPSLMGRFEGTTLLSTDSVDALVRQYPHTTIAEFIAGAWGSATPKPNEGFNIYDPLSWKQAYDKKRQRPAMDWFFNLGGFRAQSFSDYSPIFFYDYVQMFTDLAIRRLPIHIYTKVPALIKLFGGTGAKFNMSLVPEVVQGVDPEHLGLKPDGKGGWELAWHEDSFPVDEAFALRQDPRFKGNVGTIAVGISDAHIRMLLDDPRIDMVIPYHKSGMPKSVQIKTGLNNATDYTDDQKTKGKKKGLKDFSFNEALRRLGDPRKAADEYLAWCKQNKCTPKFPQFADHPNYYKVLEDFRCIDNEGNYSPQQPVQVSFFDDVEQRLSESLEDRTMQEGLDTAIRGNDAITEGIKKIMSKPRLDGKIRDMMLARLKQVLGKDNVASLKQEDFFEELQKVYTDQMGAERAQQQVEVLRTSGGIVYGFAVGDRIVLNENYFNAETPMHEFTHVWVKVARLANPQMWAEGKELLKQTKEWQEVMSDEFYSDIQGDEDAVASEVLARIVGQDAARQINEMFAPEDKPQERPGIYNKIKQWVNKFLDGVRSLFGENAKGLTYDELVRMPMKALFDDAEAARFMEALQQVNEEEVDMSSQGSAPTFYSNAERAVQNVKQNKATAEQWKAMLTKQGGIKAGEDKWMGLSTWLDEHKGETLTKDDVLQFVRDNAVQMEEVNYSELVDETVDEKLKPFVDEFNEFMDQAEEATGSMFVTDWANWANDQMHEKYGDDYFMAFELVTDRNHYPTIRPLRDVDGELVDAAKYFLGVGEYGGKDLPLDINNTRLDYTTPGLDNKREIAFVVPGIESYQEHDEIHFGPENQGRAVMWVRFGETTDTDGNRVLVIDEVQSNRHQDAREKGYAKPIPEDAPEVVAFRKADQEQNEYLGSLRRKYGVQNLTIAPLTEDEKRRKDEVIKARFIAANEVAKFYEANGLDNFDEGIPAAPFEKNWHEVAMKRMLRLAAEEGFDKVAWTTGEQQADRYGLGGIIDSIYIAKSRRDSSKYAITVFDKNADVINSVSKDYTPQELADTFGKDMAQILIDGEAEQSSGNERNLQYHIEGVDLEVGREGMRAFYDGILPQFMNKYGKRWGVKVGEVTLDTPGKEVMHSVDVTPEMRRSVMTEGQPLFQIENGGNATAHGTDQTRSATATNNKRHLMDPRSGVPNVRGGWTENKILRYLKSNSTKSGVKIASRAIAEFDSIDELKEHMFYHGTRSGSDRLKPSIAFSDREFERIGGGGGYGDKYWGISVSKSKRVSSNFSTGRGVNIYPIILLKGAKVIERPDFSDAWDAGEHIVELWEQGVDAVWIGQGKQGGGEQELLILNPQAVVNIGTPDFYEMYHLGSQDNPLNIADDEAIARMYETAKEFAGARKPSKPMKPQKPLSLYRPAPSKPSYISRSKYIPGEGFRELTEEEYQAEKKRIQEEYEAEIKQRENDLAAYNAAMEEYERKMEEYNNSEEVRKYNELERKAIRDIRFRDDDEVAERDREYQEAVEKKDDAAAQKLVDDAAKAAGMATDESGKLIDLYHGTDRFGFTIFDRLKSRMGAFFTSTRRNVAANYAGDDHYAGVRKINKGYKQDDSQEGILNNARSVFDQDWKMATEEQKQAIVTKVEADARKVADEIDKRRVDAETLPADEDLDIFNAVAWVEHLFYTVAYAKENGNEGEDLYRLVSDGVDRYNENKQVIRDYVSKHYDELDEKQKNYLNYLTGWDSGDVAIDIECSYKRVVSGKDLATVTGDSMLTLDELKKNTDETHNIGAYHLFGNLGDNPLVVDAEGKNWYSLEYEGRKFDTDTLAQYAKENGYTALVVKNVYDYGDKADDYIFFEPSQLKSADPATYDDNGNLIPLSQRFDLGVDDMRFREILEDGGTLRVYQSEGKWRVEGVPGEFDTQFGAVDNARNFLQGHVFEVAEDGNSIEVLGAGSNLDNMLNGRGEAATQETATDAKPLTSKERKAEERARKWRERTVANGRRRVEELGQRLGVKVTIVDDMSEQEREGMSKKKRRAKGWYDVRTGEVFINLGNHKTVSDIEATFLHEVVAHKGLRRLFGEEFNTFLHNVYFNVDASIREEINRLVAKNGWDYREATEEYLAKLAQQMNFERPDRYLKAWETVARLFRTLLQKMGLGNGMNLKDSDLQGILFESYHNMEKEGVAGLAESVEFRDAMEREANLPRQSRDTENLAATAAESMFRDDEDDVEDFEDSEDFYEEELEEEADNAEDLGEEVDDSEAGPSTFQEMMLGKMLQAANSAGAAQSARVSAMRSLGGALQQIRKAMSTQRNYDRDTVNTIVRLAREVMASGYFNDLTRGEVKRLLAAAKNVNGSANVTEQANKVVDTLLRHHLRECENLLKKQLKVKGSKENASGVEVQAGLDIEGQRMTTAMKQGMRLDEQGLSDRVADCLSRMGSSDPVLSSVAAQEYAGLMLAQQYHDTIKASRQEEQQMREEMRQAKAEFAARRDSLSPEELKRQRQDLKDYIAATEDAIRQNRMERADAYNQLSEMLGGGIASSMERAKQWREQQKERVRDIQHNANSDLEGVPADEHMRPTWKHRMANWSVVRFFMKPLATFDYMLRMMGQKSPNGEGYLWNRFMGGWVEANDKEFRNIKAAHNVLDEKVKEVFNADRPGLPKFKVKRWSDLFFIERKMKGMDVDFWDGDEIKTHTLTPGNLLYIYMVNKMSDGKMKLRKMGISEEDVEAIKNHLDPRLIELADWLQDEFLVQKRTEYNAVHERMFGAPMAAIENYFPLKINSRSRSQEEDVNNQDANPDDNRGSTITGAIIKRVRNNKALDVTGADAFDVILEHIQTMEHWAAFAEFNRDLNTLLSYKRFRNRMLNMASARFGSGKKLWTNFKRVCAIASGVYRPKVDYDSVDTNLVNVAKGVTRAKISFRFYTALKQLLSYPAYLSTANPIELAKSSNPVGAVKAWNWAIDNLPGFAERWQSRQAGDTRLKDSDADWGLWKSKIIDTASRWGMSPNAFIDALTVAMGAKAIYETKFKQYKKLGYPEEQAKRRAQRDASVAYNETQQSSANAYTSAMQLDRTAASVALTVFCNASMGYQRRLFQSFANLKHMATKGYRAQSLEYLAKQMERDGLDRATAEAAAKKVYNRMLFQNIADVAIFGWVMQAAWNLGAYLPYLFMGDDDDDKKDMLTDAALHAIAGGIEGLTGGSVISDTYNSIRSGDAKATYSNELLPLLSDIESLKRTFKKDVIEGANDLVNLIVQAGVGVNPQTITDWVVAGLDMANGDPEVANEWGLLVMRVMSAPQGQLDQLYIDELGMTAGDARKLNAEEFANRYARYKMGRESTFTGWAYSEQGHNDAVDRYVKNFGKKVQERLVGKDIATLDDAYERGDDYMKDIVGKAIKKRLEAADDSELPGIYKYTTNEVTKKTAGGEMAKRISKNEELDSYFDKQRDPVLRKAAASEIAKRLGTQDYAGKTPQAKWTQETKDAHERYQDLRLAADVKEDCQVTLLKVSDEEKAELREIKKQLGQGGDDAAIMQEYREARKEILKNYQ